MKGIVRQLDELGRVVIPKEMRNVLGIKARDDLELTIDEEKVVIKKVKRSCAICGTEEDLIDIDSKSVCRKCAKKVKETIK